MRINKSILLTLAITPWLTYGEPFAFRQLPDANLRVNYLESALPPYKLEDPLTFCSGEKVRNSDDWKLRRQEILDLFSREMYGKRPPEPETLITDLVDEKITEDGTVIRRQHDMFFKADRTGPKIRWITFLPRQAKGKVPVIIFLNFYGNHALVNDADIPITEAWMRNDKWSKNNRVMPESRGLLQRPQDSVTTFPLAKFVRRGYAVMSACYCEVSPDPDNDGKGDPRQQQEELAYTGVFELWPKRDPANLSETTSLGAWSWALSRGLDLAGRQGEIDARKSVVTGCSRLAKAAMLAGAYDERFAVCVPVQTGGGGAPLSKRDYGENIATEIRYFSHWFSKSYCKYENAPWQSLTFDQHLILSAVAPRALLVLGFNERWFDTRGEYLACRAASCVWERFCGSGLPKVEFPKELETYAIGSKLGYARRPGGHGINDQDWKWMMDFADVQFGRKTVFPGDKIIWRDFQREIDQVALQGGGRVTIPRGRYLTRGLKLPSNVELHLEKGATLEGSSNTNDYPVVELPYSEGKWMAVVMAVGATNVSVTGEGEIYGNGTVFPRAKCKQQEGTRPRGLFFGNCRGVKLTDFSLRDAGCWGCVVQCCEDVEIRRLKIDNHANYNNDGLDIEAKNVVIEGCDIDSSDDGICLKSNNPEFTVENVLVTNCTVRSFCVPLKLGTSTHGIVRNVLFTNCRTEAPYRDFSRSRDPLCYQPFTWRNCRAIRNRPGIMADEPAASSAIAVECVDGGLVENFTFRNIHIEGGCTVPIFVRANRREHFATGAPRGQHNIMRNLLFENIDGYSLSAVPSSVTGIPTFRIQGVTFRNVHLVSRGIGDYVSLNELPPPLLEDKTPGVGMFTQALPAHGLWARYVDDLKLEDTTFSTDTRPAVVLEEVK